MTRLDIIGKPVTVDVPPDTPLLALVVNGAGVWSLDAVIAGH